ncbi:MAG: C40 family peptidase [Akkermansiaceae bacterium]
MRLFFTIVIVACTSLTAWGEKAKTSYSEGGKTYHQPAVICSKQLLAFEKYTEVQQELTRTALASIPANKWLRYKFGGASSKAGGFDCSGAMYYTLRKAGYKPPRTSAQQYIWIRDKGTIHAVTSEVTKLDDPAFKHLKPGDLLFWSGTYVPTDGRKVKITHVSMYLGKEKDGRHVMAGATKGRSYRGKRGDGFGVYDFKLPRKGSRSKFVGYGTPPAAENKASTPEKKKTSS